MYVSGSISFNESDDGTVYVGLRSEANAWRLQHGVGVLNSGVVPVDYPVEQGHEDHKHHHQAEEESHIAGNQ